MKTVKETTWHVLTAPGIRFDGEEYIECEAALHYDDTNYNPEIYWAPVAYSYDQVYTCCSYGYDAVKRWAENPDRLKNHRLRWLISVDLENLVIKEVKRTVTIEDDIRVAWMMR